jgi:hypothetical protein
VPPDKSTAEADHGSGTNSDKAGSRTFNGEAATLKNANYNSTDHCGEYSHRCGKFAGFSDAKTEGEGKKEYKES